MTQGKITRKWEAFPGQNRFYCNGRLMTAPHSGVFLLTVFLITGTSALFFIFDCKYLAENVTIAIPIIGALLFIFTMSSLLRTSLTDPGIIPRATNEEANYVEKQIEVTNSANSPTYRPPPRTKEVLVKGQTIKLKYCFTCKIFRPPRASHCSLCDNCVDRFDHHCPWVGNCVGRRNYRFFYMFIVSLAFLAVFIFACAIAHLILISKEDSRQFLDAVKESPPSIIVALICFFSVWSILGLAGFHTYLTTSNQTTNEDIKGSFSNTKRGQESFNPYSQGNVCSNCFYILCGPLTPSLIDRRGLLTESYMAEMPRPIMQEPVLPMKPYPIQNMNGPTHITMNTNEMPGIYRQTTETTESNAGSVTHLVTSEQPLAIQSSLAQQQQYKSQPSLLTNHHQYTTNNHQHHQYNHQFSPVYHNVGKSSSASAQGGSSPPPPQILVQKSQSLADNLNSSEDLLLSAQNTKFNMEQNDMTVHDRENSLLSANRLRLLQDTTMIESALDLDSLDDSSLGTNSQNGLMKVLV